MFSIREYTDSNYIYSIMFSNIVSHPRAFYLIKEIVKQFAVGTELFFGHYRLDGFNISYKKMSEYSTEIPRYFKTYGEYHPIDFFDSKSINIEEGLIACRCPNDENVYEIFEKVFHYYWETILFCPKIDWITFIETHRNYMKYTAKDYVANGYTDFLFSYTDSGDFSVFFDSRIYSPVTIRRQIDFLVESVKE